MQCNMEKNDFKPEAENPRKRRFIDSAKYIKASFILGIVVLLLSVVYVFAWDYLSPIIDKLPYQLKKLPVYLNGCFILAVAIVGTILGGLSFRKEKNIYGILGFILNFIVVGFIIFALINEYGLSL